MLSLAATAVAGSTVVTHHDGTEFDLGGEWQQVTLFGSLSEALGEEVTVATPRGVLASYASLGDVVLAEPGALMSFAGPRVVAQTTREKLPDDFGLAESNYRFGHLDAIVTRSELRPTLGRILRLFGPR